MKFFGASVDPLYFFDRLQILTAHVKQSFRKSQQIWWRYCKNCRSYREKCRRGPIRPPPTSLGLNSFFYFSLTKTKKFDSKVKNDMLAASKHTVLPQL